MEFVFEHTRLLDLKRWKKLTNMNYSTNPDYFLGPWVNVQAEIPTYFTTANIGKVRVKIADGTIVTIVAPMEVQWLDFGWLRMYKTGLHSLINHIWLL